MSSEQEMLNQPKEQVIDRQFKNNCDYGYKMAKVNKFIRLAFESGFENGINYQKYHQPSFEELELLEQNVHNNSTGFHSFLDEQKIQYKQNGHFTTIIGNHDLFWLGINYGKYWQSSLATTRIQSLQGENERLKEALEKNMEKVLNMICTELTADFNNANEVFPASTKTYIRGLKDYLINALTDKA